MSADKRYLAGIIDADGWIGIKRCKSIKYTDQYSIEVGVKNTCEELILWLQNNYSGSVTYINAVGNCKGAWTWCVRSNDAMRVLKYIYKYLIVKKERVLIAVEFSKTLSRKHCGKRLPQSILNERILLYNKMKQLNKRGV